MRKMAIPRSEIQVLKRLREAREKLGLTQPEFAKPIKMSRGQLANYEYLKAPLPFSLGMRICHHYIIGERWLATGKGPFRQLMDLGTVPSRYLTNYNESYNESRFSFLTAYQRFYVSYAEKKAAEMEKAGELFRVNMGAVMELDRSFVKNYLYALIEQWMATLENESKFELLCGFLAKEGTAYVSKLASLKVEYDWDETKRYFVNPDGKKEEIEPFGEEREKYLEGALDEQLKTVLNITNAKQGLADLVKTDPNLETTEKLEEYLTKNIDGLRILLADKPEQLETFERFLRQKKGETVFPRADLEWEEPYKAWALETKQDMAEYVQKHIKKIRSAFAGTPDTLKIFEDFLEAVKSPVSVTTLHGFSPLQAKKLMHHLNSIGLGKLDPDLMRDGPYHPEAKILKAAKKIISPINEKN